MPDLARRGRAANPIAHVLQAIDEPLDLLTYNKWNVLLPEGTFMTEVGGGAFEDVLQKVSPGAISEWRVRPLTPTVSSSDSAHLITMDLACFLIPHCHAATSHRYKSSLVQP